jgi:ligand-binding sensor domain-containing protein/two-component sensor histidine kinase
LVEESMKKKILILFSLFFSIACLAQLPALYFDRITIQNGLSNNNVNCILQDKRGFTWIGTNDGLNRYDGNYFVIFRNRPGDSTSISGNIITGITEDDKGVLWIVTADGGLSRYDYRLAAAKQFRQYKHLPGDSTSIPTNAINKLLEDKNDFLWLASNGYSVIRFNKKTEKFDRPVKGGPKTALDLAFDGQGTIWVGRQGGGILKINPRTLQAESDKRYEDLYNRLPHVVVTSLFCDSEKKMWYGSWDKVLYKYDPVTKAETVYQENGLGFTSDEVSSFAEDKQGCLWIGGKTKGLQLFDKTSGRFSNYLYNPSQDGSLADNTVRCIFIDKSGKTWIGTTRGISVCNPAQEQFVQTFLPETAGSTNGIRIYDFYKDEKHDLWIGTGNGLYVKKNNSTALLHKPLVYKEHALTVSKFFMDSRGAFYIGTNYSLFMYDRAKNDINLLPNTEKDQVMNKIIESRVVSITEDKIEGNPVLIVSPYGHFLAYYDLVRQKWVSRRDTVKNIIRAFNIKDNLVRKLYKTEPGHLWLANVQEGLGEWTGNPLQPIVFYKNDPFRQNGLSNNNIYDIVGDTGQHLWISTYGGGLHYMNTKTKNLQHIPATNNLLEGIAMDAGGNVWMITNGNLQLYNRQTGSSNTFQLPDIEKSGGVTGYIYRDDSGMMYVAGKNYFIRFHPDSVKDTRKQPPIFLTDFKIFNTSYSSLLTDKTIHLTYRQNYFTVEFSAPEYSIGEPVQYSYKLEGWDKEWVDIGTRNFATFSNLEGGTYTFRVRATNKPGIWSEEEQTIKIVVVPPFWKRWWFYALCVLIVSGVLFAFYRYRVNELLKRQAIRNKIGQDLHDNLGSTLSSISVYSQVAKIHGEKNDKENLNQLLEKISTTSNEMVTEMNDIVWAINPRNDSMEKIIQRMESFAKPLAAARNIQFELKYDPSILSLQLDMGRRKNFYLIFKEAVNNAIKYSGATQLVATITSTSNQLMLIVADNGVGFNQEIEMTGNKLSLSGNGLHNMHKRAKEFGGKLTIDSQPGKGAGIKLQVPLS